MRRDLWDTLLCGISVGGKQIPESLGIVQPEMFQLYISWRAHPKLTVPGAVQAEELLPVLGGHQRPGSSGAAFAAAPSSGDPGSEPPQGFLQGIRKKPCQNLASQKE